LYDPLINNANGANEMNAYKIIAGYSYNKQTGAQRKVWNVIDPRDGFVIDTFSLKRDAKAWIERIVTA